jgi:hypothetical protein
VTEHGYVPGVDSIEVRPAAVISQVFPARRSSIPDIRDFVRRCLADSPLAEEGNREVGQTVFRALLDAAGPTGSIQVAFRVFPEHVEVDVLNSDVPLQAPFVPSAAATPAAGAAAMAEGPITAEMLEPRLEVAGLVTTTFAEWMGNALRREGLTHAAAARELGVSVKTVSRWVGGATQPRMRDMRRIKAVFGEVPIH